MLNEYFRINQKSYNMVVCREMCSIAANKSCFILTNNLPFFHGFCRFRGLKSSLRHRSLFPITATRQKFLSFSFSYRGPSLPLRMTAILSCLMTRSTTSLAVVPVVTEILTLVPCANPTKLSWSTVHKKRVNFINNITGI